MVRKPALAGAAICFVSVGVLEPDSSPLKIAAGVLFWVLLIWALLPAVRGRSAPRRQRPIGAPQQQRGGARQETAPPARQETAPSARQTAPSARQETAPSARQTAPSARRETAASRTRARCTWHQNKAIYLTEREAWDFVELSQRRYAAGRWSGKPMDHAYRCPVLPSRHWHVSSQPRRPW